MKTLFSIAITVIIVICETPAKGGLYWNGQCEQKATGFLSFAINGHTDVWFFKAQDLFLTMHFPHIGHSMDCGIRMHIQKSKAV